MRYPKVAIVSVNPIRGDQANGILMRSIFRDWPSSQLAQIYFPVAVTNMPDRSICQQYRLIRLSGRSRIIPGICGDGTAEDAQRVANEVVESGPMKRQFTDFVKRQSSWMPILKCGLEGWYAHSHLGRSIEQHLRELRPDCVYALLGNYCLTKMTLLACQRLGLPLYVHITDDFVTSLYKGMPFANSLRAASENWIRRAVSYASGLAAISPVMAEHFEVRVRETVGLVYHAYLKRRLRCSARCAEWPATVGLCGQLGTATLAFLSATGNIAARVECGRWPAGDARHLWITNASSAAPNCAGDSRRNQPQGMGGSGATPFHLSGRRCPGARGEF